VAHRDTSGPVRCGGGVAVGSRSDLSGPGVRADARAHGNDL